MSRTIQGPKNRWKDSDTIKHIVIHDSKHIPYTKRPFEVDSKLVVNIERNETADWVELSFTEVTTTKTGRVASRTIGTMFTIEQAKRIAQFMMTGE